MTCTTRLPLFKPASAAGDASKTWRNVSRAGEEKAEQDQSERSMVLAYINNLDDLVLLVKRESDADARDLSTWDEHAARARV